MLPQIYNLWTYKVPYPSAMIFHTVLLLIKELTSQQKKDSHGPRLMEFTGLTVFPPLKQLV